MTTSGAISLDDLPPGAQAEAGGKAWNCARLKQAGFPVPDGLVVMATVGDEELGGLPDDPWFDEQPDGTRFAVRSSGIGEDSAGHSFAGIHQTLLDVSREDVGRAVRACRASAHTEQARAYRKAAGLGDESAAMGVLVQRMVRPVAAGVAFSVNPVTGAAHEVVINSAWGIGEALVSGHVDPDEFVVRKSDGAPLWSRLGDKGGDRPSMPSLTPMQVAELAALTRDVERHYGAPQDVEWCHDGTRFWIVQSRPVTTPVSTAADIEWTRANLAEVLPDQMPPQTLDGVERTLIKAQQRHFDRLLAPEDRLGPIVKAFHGRLYFNLTQMRHVCAIGNVAPAEMLRSMGHAEAIAPADEVPGKAGVGDRVRAVPTLLRMAWRHMNAARLVKAHDRWVVEKLAELRGVDPRAWSDEEMSAAMDRWVVEAPELMQLVLLLAGVLFHELPVRNACAAVGMSYEQLVYPQLAAGDRSVSAQQAFDLHELADAARDEPRAVEVLGRETRLDALRQALAGTRFLARFEAFLDAYGHRGRYESDWSLPRLADDPTPIVMALRMHLAGESGHDAAALEARQRAESEAAWQAFESRLSWWQRLTLLPRVRAGVRRIKQYYLWREQVRSDMIRVMAEVRKWQVIMAARFVERGWLDEAGDYFMLHVAEIQAACRGHRDPATLRALAAERRAVLDRQRGLQLPLLMHESDLPRLLRASGVSGQVDDDAPLEGLPVSGGIVEGEVVVVRDPTDFGRMTRGAILVAPATDPAWTPLFTLASGVIVEVGGVLSHASTIAREYGLPAVANVRRATRRLKTGERVRLDAVAGVVTRLRGTGSA